MTDDQPPLQGGAEFHSGVPAISLLEKLTTMAGRLLGLATSDLLTRLLIIALGVGAVVALSFWSAVDDPGRFRRTRDVSSWLGLTLRRWQSGKTHIVGRITKVSDTRVRTMLRRLFSGGCASCRH